MGEQIEHDGTAHYVLLAVQRQVRGLVAEKEALQAQIDGLVMERDALREMVDKWRRAYYGDGADGRAQGEREVGAAGE